HALFFSSRRRHTRSYGDWSSDVCSSDLDQRGWGWHPLDGWRAYVTTIKELGQINRDIAVDDVVKNDWVLDANAYDHALVTRTAQIGRASCRERVEDGGGAVRMRQKTGEQ